MYSSRLLIILLNLLLSYIRFAFGASTQDCGIFFGPTGYNSNWLCRNPGGVAYECSAPKDEGTVPLVNCKPYTGPPSSTSLYNAGSAGASQSCTAARKKFEEDVIDCGLASWLNGKFVVTATFRCDFNNAMLYVAYGCEPVKDQSIVYEVDYKPSAFTNDGSIRN
ncbi:uncharacterized protein MELLADRAFT_124226 [Melampsora larici-populina 98AG31]|uniref:Secreted protein n=1 Tax=Melampsora larici-populina (strain 98AG31 / pathotype 3-4-7) TaxID=747676 RepID=F4RH75_MELLP|nr:uncharacterized protein MELLADRAFT_124226 [Melampsora larici-populina 98AG31]EGG08378.1 secreted protein [Melampsora larici-populina 98AG31]